MAVFPESMDKLNVEDSPGSLSIIENYIRYMGERIEFSMRNMTRNVTDAGVSNAEVYLLLVALQNELSAVKSTVQAIQGEVTALQGSVTTMQGNITTLTNNVADLTARVEALEAQSGGGGGE